VLVSGGGFEQRLAPSLSLFGELGHAWHGLDAKPIVQQEVVYTHLVRRHNVHNRPVPVRLTGPYDQDSYETDFTVDNGLIARVGLTWHATRNIKLDLAYRHQPMDTYLAIWDAEQRAAGGGWWEERDTISASALELRLGWRF